MRCYFFKRVVLFCIKQGQIKLRWSFTFCTPSSRHCSFNKLKHGVKEFSVNTVGFSVNQICHFLSSHNFPFSLISWCFPSKSKKGFQGKESFWDQLHAIWGRKVLLQVRKTVKIYLSNKTNVFISMFYNYAYVKLHTIMISVQHDQSLTTPTTALHANSCYQHNKPRKNYGKW